MPFSSIFLLITVSTFPCVNEYSSIKASNMKATNILKENEIDREKKVNLWNVWWREEALKNI